jgi:hypothetical protein
MKLGKLLNIFAVVILLFVIGTPLAMAQDATEEAPAGDVVVVDDVIVPVEEAPASPTIEERATTTLRDAVIAILVVVSGAIGTITILLARTNAKVVGLALEKMYLSVPSYLQPSVASALEGGVGRLSDYAKSTPYQWDDEFVSELQKVIDPIVKSRIGQLVAQMAQAGAKAKTEAEETP